MNLAQFAIPMACEVPVGAFAVWQIPELGVSVPLYKGQGTVAQKQVDAENSASYMPYGCGHIIADHAESVSNNGKGRWEIGRLRPDDMAFLIRPNRSTEAYRCVQVARVDVHRSCYTLDGIGMYPHSVTDIVCACCTDNGPTENYWALFKRQGVMP